MAAGRKGFLGFIGFWAFIIGFILAIVAGIFWPTNQTIVVVLVILGVIIGFLNVTAKEFMLLLLATIALVVVGNAFAPLAGLRVGEVLGNILSRIGVLVAPAAIIAAVKALWSVAKPGE
jgi:hypothetical protein